MRGHYKSLFLLKLRYLHCCCSRIQKRAILKSLLISPDLKSTLIALSVLSEVILNTIKQSCVIRNSYSYVIAFVGTLFGLPRVSENSNLFPSPHALNSSYLLLRYLPVLDEYRY